MTANRTSLIVAAAAGLLTAALPAHAADPPAKQFSAGDLAFFETEVLPVLTANCFKCHGEGKVRGGLRLTSRESVFKGGDRGPAVSRDKPNESNLVKAINYKDDLEMPPTGKLAAKDIDILTRWVKMGAPFPAGAVATREAKAESKAAGGARSYWAYQPVKRIAVPAVKNPGWLRNPVD